MRPSKGSDSSGGISGSAASPTLAVKVQPFSISGTPPLLYYNHSVWANALRRGARAVAHRANRPKKVVIKVFSNGSRLILGMVSLVFASGVVRANDVYIAQNSVGANNGSSCANAYAVSYFNTTGNWGTGTNKIGPGTTVHLCGTFTGPTAGSSDYLSFKGGGSAGNPVTLLFEPGAVLTSPYWGSVSVIGIRNVSYVVVDGGTNGTIRATLAGSPGTACSGGACSYTSSAYVGAGVGTQNASQIEIKNLTVSNIYVHAATEDNGNGESAGVSLNGGSGLSVHNNTIHDVRVGVFTEYTPAGMSNVSVFDNEISNINFGVAGFGDGASSLTGLLVYRNRIHDFQNWDDPSDSYQHHNGIYFWAESTGDSIRAPIAYYNNYIYGNFGGSHCTAGIFMSSSAGTIDAPWIFNNVIDQSGSSCGNGVISILNMPNGPRVYNNTLIAGMLYGPNSSGAKAVLTNNIWSPSPAQATYATAAGLQSSDYNIWYNVSRWFYNNSTYSTFAAWKALGFDAHGITTNPNLTVNYRPNAGSPVISAGANLYGLCDGQPNPGIGALCYDAAGKPRPTSGPWDIGAYQYFGAPPSAPAGLTAIAGTGGL